MEGNNFNQRLAVHLPNEISRTVMGCGHEGNEPKVIQKCGDRDKDGGYTVHNYSNCIPANPMSDRGQLLMEESNKKYRIRKLTENECFVLMGFNKEDCEKCKAVGVSKSQLYRQAGNSIVTNCIQLIWEHIYKSQYDPSYVTYDENFTQAALV